MNAMAWILTAAGGLGIVGLIGLAIFAPPLALTLWKAISAIAAKMMESRAGVAVLVAIAVFTATSWYQKGVDQKRFDAMTAEFRLAQQQRDANIEKNVIGFVVEQQKQEAAAQERADHDVAEFKKAVDPVDQCRIRPDGAARLRHLWGLEGQHLKGVR